MTEPTYGMFTTRAAGGVTDFIRNLTAGVPARVPEGFNINSVRSACRVMGKELGCQIAIRTIDGETWLCKLKPEDAQ